MDSLPYRLCAGIVLACSHGKVFAGQRLDSDFDAWQMPQGGIDDGEEPLAAARRELSEETGIAPELAEFEAEFPDWLDYDLPEDLVPVIWGGRFRGQRQKWFLFRFKGQDSDINIDTSHPEFSAWRWMDADEIVRNAVWFKSDIYRQVMRGFAGRL